MRRTTRGLLFSAVVLLAALPALADRDGWGNGPGGRGGPRWERGGNGGGFFDDEARRDWREERREAREVHRARMRENCRNLADADTPREERRAMRQMRRDRIDFLHDRREAWEMRRARREACRNVLRNGFPSDEEVRPALPLSL
jgi:hypothetical protein